jgi:hypothetical protein
MDFWLGNWNVAAPGSSGAATSNVHLTLDQCVLTESWDGGRGHKGENVFAYSAEEKIWYGLFADNDGRVHVLRGKVTPGAAEFQTSSRDPQGKTVVDRVRIVRLSADRVQQLWEKSTDNGASWTGVFQGEYSRSQP